VATSDRTGEDAQSNNKQQAEAVFSTEHHAFMEFSLNYSNQIDSFIGFGKRSAHQCRIVFKERKKQEAKFSLSGPRKLLLQQSGKSRRLISRKLLEREVVDAIDTEGIWWIEKYRFISVIDPVLQQAESGEQALYPDAYDLQANCSIRQLPRKLNSELIAESAFIVLAPLLSGSILLLLAKLRLGYKYLLFDFDVTVSLKLLVLIGLLLSSATLLRLLHKPVRTNSSETMVTITITLSSWVKVTSSAPPHPPNLLIRMVEGEGRTYYVPLLGSPNTGYCANIAIGVQHPQEVVHTLQYL